MASCNWILTSIQGHIVIIFMGIKTKPTNKNEFPKISKVGLTKALASTLIRIYLKGVLQN